MTKQSDYYEKLKEFRTLCLKVGTKTVIHDIKDLDYNFYLELVGYFSGSKPVKELAALLKGKE